MLLEEGFEVVSTDASDQMLKYAFERRWQRRREPAFDNWVIKEANWVTLLDDIGDLLKDGFDAVLCIGHAFSLLLDSYGDQREQKQAFANFEHCVKPGGLLIIDHRNFDNIIETSQTPSDSPYYNFENLKCTTSVLHTNGAPSLVISDYRLDDNVINKNGKKKRNERKQFRMLWYPHKLKDFTNLLDEAFSNNAKHTIYGDFKPLNEKKNPNYYIHVLEK